jgi:hypothetical protein
MPFAQKIKVYKDCGKCYKVSGAMVKFRRKNECRAQRYLLFTAEQIFDKIEMLKLRKSFLFFEIFPCRSLKSAIG